MVAGRSSPWGPRGGPGRLHSPSREEVCCCSWCLAGGPGGPVRWGRGGDSLVCTHLRAGVCTLACQGVSLHVYVPMSGAVPWCLAVCAAPGPPQPPQALRPQGGPRRVDSASCWGCGVSLSWAFPSSPHGLRRVVPTRGASASIRVQAQAGPGVRGQSTAGPNVSLGWRLWLGSGVHSRQRAGVSLGWGAHTVTGPRVSLWLVPGVHLHWCGGLVSPRPRCRPQPLSGPCWAPDRQVAARSCSHSQVRILARPEVPGEGGLGQSREPRHVLWTQGLSGECGAGEAAGRPLPAPLLPFPLLLYLPSSFFRPRPSSLFLPVCLSSLFFPFVPH